MTELADRLSQWGGDNLRVGMRVYDNEGHVPLSGFHDGLRTLCHDWFPFEAFLAADWPELMEHYSRLSEHFGFPITIPASIGRSAVNRILQAGDTTQAVRAYRQLLEVYPGDEITLRRLEALTGGR